MHPTCSEWHHAANMLTHPLYFHATPALGRLLQLETTKVGALSHVLLQSVFISHACSQCSQIPSLSQGISSISSATGAGSEGWVRRITSSAMLNDATDYGKNGLGGGRGIGREEEQRGGEEKRNRGMGRQKVTWLQWVHKIPVPTFSCVLLREDVMLDTTCLHWCHWQPPAAACVCFLPSIQSRVCIPVVSLCKQCRGVGMWGASQIYIRPTYRPVTNWFLSNHKHACQPTNMANLGQMYAQFRRLD